MKTILALLSLATFLVCCTEFYQTQAPTAQVPVQEPAPVADHRRHEAPPPPPPPPKPEEPLPAPQALDKAIWHLNYAKGVLKDKKNDQSSLPQPPPPSPGP